MRLVSIKMLIMLLVSAFLLSACDLNDDRQARQLVAENISRTMFDQRHYQAFINSLSQAIGGGITEAVDEGAKGKDISRECKLAAVNGADTIFTDKLTYDDFISMNADFYADNFSLEELNDLSTFYQSGIGKILVDQGINLIENQSINYSEIFSNMGNLSKFMEFSSSPLAHKMLELLPKLVETITIEAQQTLFTPETMQQFKQAMLGNLANAIKTGQCKADDLNKELSQ